MDKHFPQHASRRSILGLGLGLTALTATPLGSLLGLSSEALAAAPGAAGLPTDPGAYISFTPRSGSFPLFRAGAAAPVLVSDRDHAGVVRVAGDLQADIERVTGVRPVLSRGATPKGREIVIVGTIGRSPLIDGLIAAGKLNVSGIKGKWETSLQTVVEKPLPGVDRAFVIAGSDQRGTIYGTYDVSRGSAYRPGTGGTTSPPYTGTVCTSCPAATPRAPRP